MSEQGGAHAHAHAHATHSLTVRAVLREQGSLESRRLLLLSPHELFEGESVAGEVYHVLVRVHAHEVAA